MDPGFKAHVDSLAGLLRQLLKAAPAPVGAAPASMPRCGVYLLSENSVHLYVGRSNRLRERMGDHGHASSGQTKSAFAFRITKETLADRTSSPPRGTREELMQNRVFLKEFIRTKDRVARMEVRCVEVPDPVRQALCEIYAATVLKTPYNHFNTH